MSDAAVAEAPHESDREGFADSVTVAFGDLAASVFGVVRVGLSGSGDDRAASGLAILFADGEPVCVQAQGGVTPTADGWAGATAAGVRHQIAEPLQRWRLAFASDDGDQALRLELEALSTPALLDPDTDAGKLGGMAGYEQLVRVSGTAKINGKQRQIGALGQRGHSWGAPDWSKLSLARTVSAWFADESAVTLTSIRSERANGHGDEAAGAFLIGEGSATPIADPRLSTTFDDDGRQRAAGLELYVGEKDDFPHRAAGEVICGTTLDLGRLRMDTAFMRWRMEGREGVGRYDVVRRVE